MTANELLNVVIQIFFILLGIVTVVDFLRHRDAGRRDIALLFSLFAALFVIPIAAYIVGQGTIIWSQVLTTCVFSLEPYILLRLLRYLRPVPNVIMRSAQIGSVVLIGVIILVSTRMVLPAAIVLLIEGYFVLLNAYAMVRFVQGAATTSGVVRKRLLFAAAGAGLLALILVAALLGTLIQPLQPVMGIVTRALALGCALAFYIAFATPRWLRLAWQHSELTNYLMRSGSAPAAERLNLAEMMTELSQAAVRAVAGMAAGVVQQSTTGSQWRLNHAVGEAGSIPLDGVQILDRAWQERKPMLLRQRPKNSAHDSISEAEQKLLSTVGAESLLVIPIATQDQVWGLLVVFQKYGSLFPEDDLNLLTMLAGQNAIFLDNSLLIQQMRGYSATIEQSLQLTEALYDVSRQLLQATDYRQILQAVLDSTRAYGTDAVALFSVDPDDSGKPTYLTNIGRIGIAEAAGSPIGMRYQLTDIPVFRYLLESPEEVMYVEDTLTDERYQLTQEVVQRVKLRAIVQMPLSIDGQWIGVLNINWATPHHFSGAETQFFNALYPLLTTVVDRERLRLSEQQAHDKLAEREAHYRLLADNISDMISKSTMEGTITYASPSSAALLGYSPDEMIGQTPSSLAHPDDLVILSAPVAAPNLNGGSERIYRVRHQDGHFVWVETASRLIVDEGGNREVVSVTRDISKRMQAEAALRESETKFRLLMESAPEAIIISDQRGRITLLNLEAERMFGYSRDELIGQNIDLLVPESLRQTHRHHREDFVKAPSSRSMGEGKPLLASRKDGSTFQPEISLNLINMQGESMVISMIADISERKQAEEAIRKLNAELGQRASQLAIANRELEAFSYSVSHDLRAPLRALDGFSQAIEEDYGDRLDEQALKYLGRIRSSSQRMGQLIDDLLDLSRISRTEMRLQPVDLSAMADKVAAELREQYPALEVEFKIEDELSVTGDPKLLRVMITNLLSNAWKYSSKQAHPRVEFGSTDYRQRRAYYVRDNGAGFDMAYADKLFGVFQRLHTSNEFPGTGIGLATVQRIVHRHGGSIWAEGAVGEGATFYFSI
ncbi:MAG: PAS domain S-box protein [Anaerolineae bacterium]|nr:PAS domain S-box protein [Anaerolineae bacterium]